jgi:hypothetical protein
LTSTNLTARPAPAPQRWNTAEIGMLFESVPICHLIPIRGTAGAHRRHRADHHAHLAHSPFEA